MTNEEIIQKKFNLIDPQMTNEVLKYGVVKEFEANTEIIKEGQYIRSVPVVLKGLVKVFSRYEEKELLLYYLEEEDSCIMSFSTSLNDGKSKIYAVTEQESTVLMLPVEKVSEWIKHYPRMNDMFYTQYNIRYSELLDTIKRLLIDKMDTRLFNYLKEKAEKTKTCFLDVKHKDIASELGTAREVISRMMKKLEGEGLVKQHTKGVELLNCHFENVK